MINPKLTEISNCAKLIQQMTGLNATITIWNTDAEVVAYFKADTTKIVLDVGYKDTNPNSDVNRVLRNGKPLFSIVPKEVFGESIEGTVTPVFENNQIVGAVTFAYSADIKNGIVDNANALGSYISDTNESINSICGHSEVLSSNMNELKNITDSIVNKVNDAIEIVTSIQQNAKLSNILALNASIESARAGEAGKGFAVVSDEMRKFSRASQEASDNISHSLNEIMNSLMQSQKHVDDSKNIVMNQSNSIANLDSLFKHVTSTAEKTIEVCNNIKCL